MKKTIKAHPRVVKRYKKVELDRSFDEISEQEILDAPTRTTDTTNTYLGIIRKLKVFLKVPDDIDIPKILLTDKNLGLFSHELGRKTNYHKSQYKKMNGALNWLGSKHSLSNYFDFPHEWPLMTLASTVSSKPFNIVIFRGRSKHFVLNLIVQEWRADWREHPQHAVKAGVIRVEGVKNIYDLTGSTTRELLDLAVGSIMLSAGKRADDVYKFRSNEYQMLPCDRDCPRRHRWIQRTSKGDPESNGPESDRTTVVACICLELLDDEDRDAFIEKLKIDPFCNCVESCPFQHIKNYSLNVPDPFGEDRDSEIATEGVQSLKPPLHFVRALSTRGSRSFTKGNLGKV